jgi:hypothetical protein
LKIARIYIFIFYNSFIREIVLKNTRRYQKSTRVLPLFYKGFRFAPMNKPDYRFALAKFTLLFKSQVWEGRHASHTKL